MEFCAGAIYQGRLKSGIDASLRPPLAGFEWPRLSVPVAFVEMGGEGGEEKEGESKLNRKEAARVLDILVQVLNAGEVQVQHVGVVTPYVAQVTYVTSSYTYVTSSYTYVTSSYSVCRPGCGLGVLSFGCGGRRVWGAGCKV